MADPLNERKRLENWLNRFGSRFEIGFFVLNPTNDYEISYVNEAFTRETGIGIADLGKKVTDLLSNEESNLLIQSIREKFIKGQSTKVEMNRHDGKGGPVWIEVVMQPILNRDGEVISIVGFVFDVTQRNVNESILKLQESVLIGLHEGKALNQILQKIHETVCIHTPKAGATAYLKKEKEQWIIEKAPNLSNHLIAELEEDIGFKDDLLQSEELIVNQLTPSKNHPYIESWNLPIFNMKGKVCNVFSVYITAQNILTKRSTEYLKKIAPIIQMAITFYQQQHQLTWLAYSDPTTGLPNHHSVLREVNEKRAEENHFFLAFIQPAEYTTLLKLYERRITDTLFIELTNRMKRLNRKGESFIGKTSSEAIAFISTFETEEDIENYIRQLQVITAEPFKVAGNEMYMTLKIGIAESGEENPQAEELVRRADAALTTSKDQAGFMVSVYKDLRNKQDIREMTLTNELSKAITAAQIKVYLQPKVKLKTGEIIGFEALARWHSDEFGFIPPDEFIAIAEKSGEIIALENQVLRKVLNWLAERKEANKKMYQIAVNISVDHFFNPSFISEIKKILSENSIPPKYLKLEMTESIGLVDFKNAKEVFDDLHNIGVEIAIDDFGIGYSSLSYLPKLPVDELKIDRSFIEGIRKQETHAVITTIHQLATNLNLTTVAEGMEEAYQVEALIEIGYEVGQGYYFYKPMPLSEIDLLLDQVEEQ